MNAHVGGVYVVGVGQDPGRHLTLEGLRILESVEKVLLINGDADAVLATVKPLNNAEDIMSLYVDGDLDDANYGRIVSKVASDAMIYQSVAVCVAGHPLVGVSWWERLRIEPSFRTSLTYVEGISSWTSIVSALSIDPLEQGSIVADANRLLLFNMSINPEFDIYLFNVCSTGTRYAYLSEPSRDNRIADLSEHLARFYPLEHPVKLISAGGVDSWSIESTIGTLSELLSEMHFSSSLFIPALMPSSINKPFLRRLLDLAQVDSPEETINGEIATSAS